MTAFDIYGETVCTAGGSELAALTAAVSLGRTYSEKKAVLTVLGTSTRMNWFLALIAVLVPMFAEGGSLPELLRSTNRTGLCEFSPSWVGYLRETTKAGQLVIPPTTANRALFFNALVLHATNEAAALSTATLGEKHLPPAAPSGRIGRASTTSSAKSSGNSQALAAPERYEYCASLPKDEVIARATNEWQLLKTLGPIYGGGPNSLRCAWSPQNESWRLFSLSGEQTAELLYVNATLRKESNSLEVVGVRIMRGVARPLPVR